MEENKKTELEEQTEQISGEEKTEHTEEAETDTKNQNADSEQKAASGRQFWSDASGRGVPCIHRIPALQGCSYRSGRRKCGIFGRQESHFW